MIEGTFAKFGSSGIRGVANTEITPELALDLGFAVGSIYPEISIGHDPRIASEMIENAVVAGLLSSGSRVIKVGMVPTPTLALFSKRFGCGIMITASHNPAQYIGMKIFKDGMSFDTQQQEEIENILREKKFRRAGWENTGNLSASNDALREHSELILNNISMSSSGLKVVVDCGNGAASVITPYLLGKMGCNVITINSQPDGNFPGREPEPVEENLGILKSMVIAAGAELGIAHDGDADRMMAVDNYGRYVSGDKMLALFAVREARKAIAVPVDTSRVIDDLLDGIKISRTRVGDVYVAEALKKTGGDFGGEPSGAWIFPRVSLCPDGIYAAARLVEIVEKEGDLGKLLDKIPEYPVKRGAFPCTEKKKAMAKIIEKLRELGEINTLDGVRVDLEDGWILIRPSGTEPKIRITVESNNKCEVLYNMASDIVKEATA
ncbi:MAG: phosphoglucosamine mutase [Candidatus Methanoperedens sp.]|nr:phosphoglucosamine mutase [Candidatus Methanoperedens sp.]